MMRFHCNNFFKRRILCWNVHECLLYVAMAQLNFFMNKFWYACIMHSSKSADHDTCENHVMRLNTGSFMTSRYIQPHETGETTATSTADAYYRHGEVLGVLGGDENTV